jgi:hypothetical protein
MALTPHPRASGQGFAVRRLEELLSPPSSGHDWDVRFVSAVLLFYGLLAASFYLVEWWNDMPADPAVMWEAAPPGNDASDAARVPYLVRLPQLLKEQAAGDTPREPR